MSTGGDTNARRRHFLIGLAVVAGGVTTGRLYGDRFFTANNSTGSAEAGTTEFQPHAFVRIGTDDVVTVLMPKFAEPEIKLSRSYWTAAKFRKRSWNHHIWNDFT